MKYSFLILCLFIILFSCKKEMPQSPNLPESIMGKIKLQLKDSVSTADMQELDFSHSFISNTDISDFSIIRIPLLNKKIETDFLLLKVTPDFNIKNGRFIHIEREGKLDLKTKSNYNGRILIESLKRKLLTSSLINNGYIDAFHQQYNSRNTVFIIGLFVQTLPEVILVSHYPATGGEPISSTLYYLQSFFSSPTGVPWDTGFSSEGVSGSYSNSDPMSYNQSGQGGGQSPEPIPVETTYIDFEDLENLNAIDLKKYLSCFDKIADAGASCSIKMLVDIPVDEDPTAYFNWRTGSPGHTFLQIEKKNGSQSILQNIGFYPATSWKTLTALPVTGKYVDNGEHEFNASIKMDLSADDFKSTITYILFLSTFIKYDIDDNNCTNFALDVFNYKRRSNPLVIDKQDLPGGLSQNGALTPQAMYRKLQQMKGTSSAISDNITLPRNKNFAVKSSGPCNEE